MLNYLLKRPKILVIDDDKFNITALIGILREDYDVMAAISGDMGLAAAAKGNPDLILLDITMPGMDGYEVFQRFQSQPSIKNIPVIFITGLSAAEDEAKGLELGAADYISKPFNATVVKARVKTQVKLKFQTELLYQHAFRDGLTGIANRRVFDDALRTHWQLCLVNQKPLTVILMDIDHFKLYNDHYGHIEGDECLKKVASALESVVENDSYIVARYGGEEFVCIIPELNHDTAKQIGEAFRGAIEAIGLPHEKSLTSEVVTGSFGIATCVPQVSNRVEALLSQADDMLYQSKRAGRNMVTGKDFSV